MTAVAHLGRGHDSRKEDRGRLLEIIKGRSFRRGRFKLTSGIESEFYFNLKSTMMNPEGACLSARAFLDIIRELNVDFVGGLEMGAVPILGGVAALSGQEGEPVKTFFVRKQAKNHGTRELIEGLSPSETLTGAKILIVDDVASTGKSVLDAIEAARGSGGIVEDALVMIDRGLGAAEMLRNNGVRLHSVFHESDFR